ncbi:hypothetical protein AB8O38_10255 [Saccharomonospora xinjiangensis]|uniref:hypothetical protein n=1 Tax=Saccharomonospora xinjiangensis TaxID=75294 RepID=UPI00350F67FF
MTDDPERLLAEALRAQARYAPPAPPAPPMTPTQPVPAPSAPPPARIAAPTDHPTPVVGLAGGYGLLSGTAGDEPGGRLPANSDADVRPAPVSRGSHRREPERLPARWVLILAASIGLAVGSLLGLVTVL